MNIKEQTKKALRFRNSLELPNLIDVNQYSQEWFDKKIFSQMTSDEQYQLMCYSFCGWFSSYNPPIIMMGEESLNRVKNYKQLMIKKYAKRIY